MPKKRYSVEQIINHLREADVLLAQDHTVGEICRRIGVSVRRQINLDRSCGSVTEALAHLG